MEEKLFELMVQAEDLQKHAVELQNKAQETFFSPSHCRGTSRAENTLYGAANGLNLVWPWYPSLRGLSRIFYLEYG